MKVIYKKTILEKIQEEICQSRFVNRKIDKIILSQEEWDELVEGQRTIGCTHKEASDHLEKHGATVFGVNVEKEPSSTPSMPYILMAYISQREAKECFDVAKRYPLAQNINERDMVICIHGEKYKYASIGTMADMDSLQGSRFDEIRFGFPILEKEAALVRFQLTRQV